MYNSKIATVNLTPICTFTVPDLFSKDDQQSIISAEYLTRKELPGLSVTKTYSLLDDLNLLKIKSVFDECIRQYIEHVLQVEMEMKCIGSWATKNEIDSAHFEHNHPNSLLSLVSYFDPNDDDAVSGLVIKHKGLFGIFEGHKFSYDSLKKYADNIYNSSGITFNAKPNSIIIFPSHMLHLGIPSKSNTRYMVGANYFPNGSFGNSLSKDLLRIGVD